LKAKSIDYSLCEIRRLGSSPCHRRADRFPQELNVQTKERQIHRWCSRFFSIDFESITKVDPDDWTERTCAHRKRGQKLPKSFGRHGSALRSVIGGGCHKQPFSRTSILGLKHSLEPWQYCHVSCGGDSGAQGKLFLGPLVQAMAISSNAMGGQRVLSGKHDSSIERANHPPTA
jgi:hypothetical protein